MSTTIEKFTKKYNNYFKVCLPNKVPTFKYELCDKLTHKHQLKYNNMSI